MRAEASVLHLDLDAFFAAVEQRDKPSLRGKPVIVGGVGARGVVATASYEARAFGVHSAMAMHEARRRCPHAAFLQGRFGAYRQVSGVVQGVLRELSPLVEPLSLDEAFVDLAGGGHDVGPSAVRALAERVRAEVADRTGGLTASVGVGSSKFMAKVATELAKPNGVHVVEAGTEVATLRPLPARVIPGVGPATMERLTRLGVRTVADIQALSAGELVRELGRAAGESVHGLAWARDDRPVEPDREVKSISVEDTFERDVTDADEVAALIERHARQVAGRLAAAKLFARTVTLKVRLPDFVTHTRSQTMHGATDRPDVIGRLARGLLVGLDVRGGVRLLGVGVSGFTTVAQEELFDVDAQGPVLEEREVARPAEMDEAGTVRRWPPGADVEHAGHGRGWVWGSGLGRVTVRFETADTPPGPVRTFAVDDPELRPASLPPEPGG